MAVPTVRASATNTAAAATSIAYTKPAGLAVGDLMLAEVSSRTNATHTTPTGWTVINSQLNNTTPRLRSTIFGKVADSTDVAAASFTFSISAAADIAGGIIAITTGTWDGTLAAILKASQANASAANDISPSLTRTRDTLVVHYAARAVNGDETLPAGGYTEQYDLDVSTTFSAAAQWLGFTGAGSTGTITSTGTAAINIGQSIGVPDILRPAAPPPFSRPYRVWNRRVAL